MIDIGHPQIGRHQLQRFKTPSTKAAIAIVSALLPETIEFAVVEAGVSLTVASKLRLAKPLL